MSSNYWIRCCLLPLLLMSMLMMTGCGGCTDSDQAKKTAAELREEAKKKKPKDNFDFEFPVTFPGVFKKLASDDEPEAEAEPESTVAAEIKRQREQNERRRNRTKAGHWAHVRFPVVANNFNANGDFSATAIDSGGSPVRLQGTDFYSYSQRPVSLPQGEWKYLETTVYFPKRDRPYATSSVDYGLSGSAGLAQLTARHTHSLLHPAQYHMVVLSKRPDSYSYLRSLDCIKMPTMSSSSSFSSPLATTPFYDLVLADGRELIPLPRNPLSWTTIAYIVWDDVSPDDLDTQQQQAMLDWLHFGGQLILSGPDCLDRLRNSFLEPYLPAAYVGAKNLADDDFVELNENWSLKVTRNQDQQRMLRVGSDALLGVEWEVQPAANPIEGTGGLVVERTVGRGRIVQTQFSINLRSPVIKWQSYSSFFNGCLLRRPSRKFMVSDQYDLVFGWQDDGASVFDPLLGSTLRFLSRDLTPLSSEMLALRSGSVETSFTESAIVPSGNIVAEEDLGQIRSRTAARNTSDHLHYGGYEYDNQSGVAGWNDYSGISNAARKSLRSAAGIDPPSPVFVLKMLSIYLIVLVPLNWFLFRMIGKVEWAWVAAPIIAVAGAFAVVKMASLDIGFVRSQTQLAILELHSDYPRGHLTEYSAMYTSLSTRYAMVLDNSSALTLPFAVNSPNVVKRKSERGVRGVRISQAIDKRMEDFLIQSNFTGMLHSEMLYDTQGFISMNADGNEVSNQTALNLSGAGVVTCDEDGTYRVAWLGKLFAGQTAKLNFSEVPPSEIYSRWYESDEFHVSLSSSQAIWDELYEGRTRISIRELNEFPDIDANAMLDHLVELDPQILESPSNERVVSRNEFEIAFQKLNQEPVDQLNLGGMLFAIDRSLDLSKGEYRLIGFTDEQLSLNELTPKATQIQRMTMVLVHLKRPLQTAPRPDFNSWLDFVVDSDLKRESDKEFDFLDEPLMDLDDQDDPNSGN